MPRSSHIHAYGEEFELIHQLMVLRDNVIALQMPLRKALKFKGNFYSYIKALEHEKNRTEVRTLQLEYEQKVDLFRSYLLTIRNIDGTAPKAKEDINKQVNVSLVLRDMDPETKDMRDKLRELIGDRTVPDSTPLDTEDLMELTVTKSPVDPLQTTEGLLDLFSPKTQGDSAVESAPITPEEPSDD